MGLLQVDGRFFDGDAAVGRGFDFPGLILHEGADQHLVVDGVFREQDFERTGIGADDGVQGLGARAVGCVGGGVSGANREADRETDGRFGVGVFLDQELTVHQARETFGERDGEAFLFHVNPDWGLSIVGDRWR